MKCKRCDSNAVVGNETLGTCLDCSAYWESEEEYNAWGSEEERSKWKRILKGLGL